MHRNVGLCEARRIARRFEVKLPKVGYEVSLGDGTWLGSNGHFQFGFFEKPVDTMPFNVRCRHDECPATCPAKG